LRRKDKTNLYKKEKYDENYYKKISRPLTQNSFPLSLSLGREYPKGERGGGQDNATLQGSRVA
jgi:hypothetical protein